MFLMSICFVSNTTIGLALLAFIGIQLQGTLYNYYYVILRNKSYGGDGTSKVFEHKTPKALAGETQRSVDILFGIYFVVYGVFDKAIHFLDADAYKVKNVSELVYVAAFFVWIGISIVNYRCDAFLRMD